MTDRVFPSVSRPQNPTVPGPAKSQLYNPTATRAPYRPAANRPRPKSRRRCLCQCCIWTTILLLFLVLLAAAAAAVLYLLYRPHRPSFSVASLRLSRFNLSGIAADSPHLSSNLSLTASAWNPNSKVEFSYDDFVVSVVYGDGDVSLGNSSFPAFDHHARNTTLIRATILSSQDLDAGSYTAMRSDLRKTNRVGLQVNLDTMVRVKVGGLGSKKVGIRVSCPGIDAIPPPKKGSPIASTNLGDKCEVDLRLKIWKFTF